MHVAVSLTPATRQTDLSLFGDAVGTYVVVDILRASAVICTALQNGANSVLPVADVESARASRNEQSNENVLLCGERSGHKLPGFDLGNSPAEYTSDVVAGKNLIHASTNGSPALAQAPSRAQTLVGGLVNLTAVSEEIARLNRPTMIVCAGKASRFALEDAVGAGAIMARLWELSDDVEIVNDGATAVQAIWDRYKSEPSTALWQCEHGRYLINEGFGSDLALCAEIDSAPVVPRLQESKLVLFANVQ